MFIRYKHKLNSLLNLERTIKMSNRMEVDVIS